MKLNVKYNRILHKHRYFSNAVFLPHLCSTELLTRPLLTKNLFLIHCKTSLAVDLHRT